ncbi:hypothetical protein GH733_008998 [Mirounga leonina]|nr:hypothetical protein GH733_008998 [Mirounga leonina]
MASPWRAELLPMGTSTVPRPALRRGRGSTTSAGSGEGSVKLHEGSQVLLTSSNEMGTVRYVGPTDFASGTWLGLELRSAKGKNDGAVGDTRYFTYSWLILGFVSGSGNGDWEVLIGDGQEVHPTYREMSVVRVHTRKVRKHL